MRGFSEGFLSQNRGLHHGSSHGNFGPDVAMIRPPVVCRRRSCCEDYIELMHRIIVSMKSATRCLRARLFDVPGLDSTPKQKASIMVDMDPSLERISVLQRVLARFNRPLVHMREGCFDSFAQPEGSSAALVLRYAALCSVIRIHCNSGRLK